MRRFAPSTLLAVLAVLLTCPIASTAASLETFVLSAGGNASGPTGCSTFAAPTPVASFFGPLGVSIPIGGFAPCSIAGGLTDATALTGPITDTRALSTGWSSITYSGDTSVLADYGNLAAESHSTYAGGTSSLTIAGAEGFGAFTDGFNITSPSVANGQSGTVFYYVTVTGGLSSTGGGYADVELDYKVNAGAAAVMFRCQASNPAVNPFIVSIGNFGLGGFTLSPGTMSGSGEVKTGSIAFVFGTTFDLKLGLMAYSLPILSGVLNSDFTAILSGIEVRGPSNQLVTNFHITSTSGKLYGDGGITAVGDGPRVPGATPALIAYPNPARTTMQLRVDGLDGVDARVEIYDPAGRRVRVMPNVRAGRNYPATEWDGRGDDGRPVASGVYFVRMTWSEGSATARAMWLR
jgi:hypothetical protein